MDRHAKGTTKETKISIYPSRQVLDEWIDQEHIDLISKGNFCAYGIFVFFGKDLIEF